MARFLSVPARGVTAQKALRESAAGTTVPLWSSTATAFGESYSYVMVGDNPFVQQTNPSVTIGTDVVPIKIELTNTSGAVAHTFDPNATNDACGVTTSPATLVSQSPLFQTHDYVVGGTDVGTVQYEDAFMREQFGSEVFGSGALNPGYGVVLSGTRRPEVTVKVPPKEWGIVLASNSGACGGSPGGNLGEISEKWWDNYLGSTLIPKLQAADATQPTRMLDFVFANVGFPCGSRCTTLGYHSGISTGLGEQYYATSDYDSTGLFGSEGDIASMSHELGEWLSDPNGDNATPAWGNVGQYRLSCTNRLEVGDPLTGTMVPVTMANGVTYHPQELAFLSWFYRQEPSIGVNGWYSSNGTFTSVQPACGWSPQSPAIPPGATTSLLNGVSCISAGACTAVGSYDNSGTEDTLAEVWNGATWSVQSTPNVSGASTTALLGVSCTSTSACEAVGTHSTPSDTDGAAVAEVWNGADWQIQSTPTTPAGLLYGVSCASANACEAVGYTFGNGFRTLAEVWNGTSWRIQSTPTPTGGAQLYGVSCTSATACIAVGNYEPNPGVALTEVWNGTSWKIQRTPTPTGATGLAAVSCISTTACISVGWQNLTELWSGSSWRMETAPSPPGNNATELTGVSCTSADICTAVGQNGTDGSFADGWDGTSWQLQTTPIPSGNGDGRLWGVSCTAEAACMAVGGYDGLSGQALAEQYS